MLTSQLVLLCKRWLALHSSAKHISFKSQQIHCAYYLLVSSVNIPTTPHVEDIHIDGGEKQTVKDTDGNMTRPKIRSACIMDPYVLILREDDTLGLFVGEPSRGKVRRKDMSAFGDKVDNILTTTCSSYLPNLGLEATLFLRNIF